MRWTNCGGGVWFVKDQVTGEEAWIAPRNNDPFIGQYHVGHFTTLEEAMSATEDYLRWTP